MKIGIWKAKFSPFFGCLRTLGNVQMFSQGGATVTLDQCSEYWTGSSICNLPVNSGYDQYNFAFDIWSYLIVKVCIGLQT